MNVNLFGAELQRCHGSRYFKGDGKDGNFNSSIIQRSSDFRSCWYFKGNHRQMLQGKNS